MSKKYRVVEPGGRIARNRSGTSLDSGGHDTENEARNQTRAVNAYINKSVVIASIGDYDIIHTTKQFEESVVLWIRVPIGVEEQLRAALPFEMQETPHITLLFYPDVDDSRAVTLAAALDVALRVQPATIATITGFGDFQASEVTVALVSIPEAERYRSHARAVLEPSNLTFGLVPHVTLDSQRRDVVELPSLSWPVTELEVVRGDRVLRTISLVE